MIEKYAYVRFTREANYSLTRDGSVESREVAKGRLIHLCQT